MIDEYVKSLVRKLALKNAVDHEGKAKSGTVVAKVIGLRPEFRKEATMIFEETKIIVNNVNKLSVEEQKLELESLAPELINQTRKEQKNVLPPLPNAEMGKVVTRFPPEPSGYPHIGHAKAVILDEEYAKMYNGKLILRFDDTNPLKEKLEYYDAIRDGVEWLGVKPHIVKNTSDDMELIYNYGGQMLGINGAYVCTCAIYTIRENRKNGVECKCRNVYQEDNFERWERMFTDYISNQAIVRFRGNMQSENTAMRDPTLFRIIDSEHPLKDHKYRVWPTYDFATPIEDSVDGVTHAMRTKEYELRNELYYAIIDKLQLRKPMVMEFSRLDFDGMPVSKRKIKPMIDQGLVKNWDDPRLPTLMGLKRRGILPEAIRKFVFTLGVTKADTKPPFDVLESINRKMIDSHSIRLFFVKKPIILQVRNAPSKKIKIKNHPDVDMGLREVSIHDTFYVSGDDVNKMEVGSEIRMIDLYNVKIDEVGDKVIGTYSGDELRDIAKIHWVSVNDAINLTIMIPRKLLIGEEYNPASMEIVKGYAESYVSRLNLDDRIQFIRFGFCKIDSANFAILTHR